MWLTVRAAVGSSFSDHGWGPRTTLIVSYLGYMRFSRMITYLPSVSWYPMYYSLRLL